MTFQSLTKSLLLILSITAIILADQKCGDITIPGCEACNEEAGKGCKTCEENATMEERDGVSYCIVEETPEFSTIKCKKMIIPGCELCQFDSSKGCQICQRGAGLDFKDGVGYCVACEKNCEICEMTGQGRQCQKCMDGFVFNDLIQKCTSFKEIFGIALLAFLMNTL